MRFYDMGYRRLKEVLSEMRRNIYLKRPEKWAGFTVPRKGAITKGDSRIDDGFGDRCRLGRL